MIRILAYALIAGLIFAGAADVSSASNLIYSWADSSHSFSTKSGDGSANYATLVYSVGDHSLVSESSITSTTTTDNGIESLRLDSKVTSNTNEAIQSGASTALTRTIYMPNSIKSSQVRFSNSMTMPNIWASRQAVDSQLSSAGGSGSVVNTIALGEREYALNAASKSATSGISATSLDDALTSFDSDLEWSFGVGYSEYIRQGDLEYVGSIDFNKQMTV